MQGQLLQQQALMQRQLLMQGQLGCGPAASLGQNRKPTPVQPDKRDKDQDRIIFVGGLRKSTIEDKVMAHFAKYGQVENVDIKRLPDGSSRGFAFVKFVDKESVEKAMAAHSSHMIDNKWVDVKPQVSIEQSRSARDGPGGNPRFPSATSTSSSNRGAPEAEAPENQQDYEEKWSEKYLQASAAMQGQAQGEGQGGDASDAASASEPQVSADSANPMGMMTAMMNMAGMMNMMGMMGGMNPMMGGMNPMMGGCQPMMGGCGFQPMGAQGCGGLDQGGCDQGAPMSGDQQGAQRSMPQRSTQQRSAPY
ncbi:unnamed protein product [Polarella glacialis]|uniref:RRM domain-containing protein n=1 Tax=Polarella glacialis TaxID=89957 RepID=A0A813DFQ2_POLGL|nr:unnamed protein product [Polarella glacialis]CAE8713441.1 unnamed protein product [Polarella glacialis]